MNAIRSAGFIRFVVAAVLVAVGFLVSLVFIQSIQHRLSSASFVERLPVLLVLLATVGVVIWHVRRKRNQGDGSATEGKDPGSAGDV